MEHLIAFTRQFHWGLVHSVPPQMTPRWIWKAERSREAQWEEVAWIHIFRIDSYSKAELCARSDRCAFCILLADFNYVTATLFFVGVYNGVFGVRLWETPHKQFPTRYSTQRVSKRSSCGVLARAVRDV